jgi:uncharacterized protein YodC (DUF2158 family)
MTFKIGDVVKLKSGGPSMTIVKLPERLESSYYATWFSGENTKCTTSRMHLWCLKKPPNRYAEAVSAILRSRSRPQLELGAGRA